MRLKLEHSLDNATYAIEANGYHENCSVKSNSKRMLLVVVLVSFLRLLFFLAGAGGRVTASGSKLDFTEVGFSQQQQKRFQYHGTERRKEPRR